MTSDELFAGLISAHNIAAVETLLKDYGKEYSHELVWLPVGGKPNNSGPIEVTSDPGRALVERVTNAIDAVLEDAHDYHKGLPVCASPKEAAMAWFDVPEKGLAALSQEQRRSLAQKVVVTLYEGDKSEARIVEVRDFGTGLSPESMPSTILSLNESNKVSKRYLAGVYGQGGSSTFAVSVYTVIASRSTQAPTIGFTLVRYRTPTRDDKAGSYEFLSQNGAVLHRTGDLNGFLPGTLVKHVGFDLSNYGSPVGPRSVYGLLNMVLFDPVLPIWLDNRVHEYRRVIKGARNALNGAVDEDDPDQRGPNLDHSQPMFHVDLGDYGRIGIEYWVLERPTVERKIPIQAFVDPAYPIVLTLNGQVHAQLRKLLVRRNAELPYLAQRLICHVDCNALSASGRRALLPSSREQARRGALLNLIEDELVRALRSDDELISLNRAAREHEHRETDESAKAAMQREVARLLTLQGVAVDEASGRTRGTDDAGDGRTTRGRRRKPDTPAIEIVEPPTVLSIVWPQDEPIQFYPGQRRYIRVQTNAGSQYHDPASPDTSRLNFILDGGDQALLLRGTTPLNGGRMRVIVEASETADLGGIGVFRVELHRRGLPSLHDERLYEIVPKPPSQPRPMRLSVPPFDCIPVEGPGCQQWVDLEWPDAADTVACSAQMEEGKLYIYYSEVFPAFREARKRLEARDTLLAESFRRRYEIWLALHSLLWEQDMGRLGARDAALTPFSHESDSAAILDEQERKERCRVARLSALFARREVLTPQTASDLDEDI